MTKDCFDGRSGVEKDGMIGLLKPLLQSVSGVTFVRRILPWCLGWHSP